MLGRGGGGPEARRRSSGSTAVRPCGHRCTGGAVRWVTGGLLMVTMAGTGLEAQTGGSGASDGWVMTLAPHVSRKLDTRDGPAIGALGGAIQLLPASTGGGWRWGASLALHRVGEVEQGVALPVTERAFNAGVRAVRGSLTQGGHLALGADLVFLQNDRLGTTTTDPGVGLEVAVGWVIPAGEAGLLLSSGITGELVSGEATAGGGAYVWLRFGVVVR